ncbi:MAG TPA: hypothetical protein VFR76_02745, partial [Verrucomicrobiae bacterium]|nr:hypothetical protein [Verrucomicrobiae bacterium]
MMHPFLRIRLQRVVDRQRRFQLSCKLASCWAASALLGLGLIVLQRQSGWASSLALPVIAALGVVAAIIVALRHRRTEPDWRRLAGEVEARHLELDGLLLTAVQQEMRPQDNKTTEMRPQDHKTTGPQDRWSVVSGQWSYLQERLVQEAIRHDQRRDWAEVIPQSRLTTARVAHLLALVLFGFVLLGLRTTGGHRLLARISETGITVTPGDVSIERGNSLVVLARFGGALPVTVDLVISDVPETSRRIPLVKSLADPMFGGSVPEVTSNLIYHVEYGGQRTRDFKVTVFEHPRLERADVDLTYPDYTGQAAKHIKDTRRLSAVEGSHLDLSLQLNKP